MKNRGRAFAMVIVLLIVAWFGSTILTFATWIQAGAIGYWFSELFSGGKSTQILNLELTSRIDQAFWFVLILLAARWIDQRLKKRKAEA
jgi:hypothetical protein